MQYEVWVNGGYINIFKSFTKACELRDWFLNKSNKFRVDIIPVY